MTARCAVRHDVALSVPLSVAVPSLSVVITSSGHLPTHGDVEQPFDRAGPWCRFTPSPSPLPPPVISGGDLSCHEASH